MIATRPCQQPHQEEEKELGEENVSTNEDLMREHGILKRVLSAYEEIISAFPGKEEAR